jgi:hypothetical protein
MVIVSTIMPLPKVKFTQVVDVPLDRISYQFVTVLVLLLRRLFRLHVRSCVGSPAQHVVEHACDKHTNVVGYVGTVQQVGHWAGVERGVHEGNGDGEADEESHYAGPLDGPVLAT